MGFFDVDEYFWNAQPSLPSVLQRYQDIAMLIVRQRVVGSSGHIHRPTGGLRANYHDCHSRGAVSSTWYKSMVNTRIIHSASIWENPHFPMFCHACRDHVNLELVPDCPRQTQCVDEHMRLVVDYNAPTPLKPGNLTLYHYIVRSKEV